MDSEEYEKKRITLFNTADYKPLDRKPTTLIEVKVLKELNRCVEDLSISLRNVAPKNTKPPHLCGLLKVHREDSPLRVIVSSIGSPCHNLARYLLKIISPVAGKSENYLKNSVDFLKQVLQIKLEEGDEMVSFDAVSLFSSKPRQEAMEELKIRLKTDTKL
jgi:hypothetical protein